MVFGKLRGVERFPAFHVYSSGTRDPVATGQHGGREMAKTVSIKNLVGRTARNPWDSIVGRRPGSYQIPEVGISLMDQVDHALLERNLHQAILTCIVFEKWAEKDLHFRCKAPAVMASVYSVCGMASEAESKIIEARMLAHTRGCKDCKAQYHRRNGIYLFHSSRPGAAFRSFEKAVNLFEELRDPVESAKSLIGRGVVQAINHDFEKGLADQERAIGLLLPKRSIFILSGAVNIAAMLTKMGEGDLARQKVAEVQRMLKGARAVEPLKLLLRWIKALLLEEKGGREDLKLAGQMLGRIEVRMRNLGMQAELRVLLADRARISTDPLCIRRIASKAFDLELSREIRALIEEVIRNPTGEAITAWREGLDSYVPQFPTVA